ncbi:MAG: carbohydrate porin, partial [Thermodesulfobacteriota bacterium]
VAARPLYRTGVAGSTVWFSDALNSNRVSEGLAEKDYEGVIELNHQFVLDRGLAITPLLQYIIRPAGTGDIDDALLFGARLSLQF